MWLERLKDMKKKCGMTSKQIADASGVPKSTVDKYFTGVTQKPLLTSTKLIVHAMGYTLDDLFDENKTVAPKYKKDEIELLNYYSALNEAGKIKLLSYAEGLSDNEAYSDLIQKEKRA